jgi:hypothetical protein
MNGATRSTKTNRNTFMNFSNHLARFLHLSITPALAVFCCSWLPSAQGANPTETPPGETEMAFTTSGDAIKALQSAVALNDQTALRELFGPEFNELMTGDKVQDANNARRFATAMAQSCRPVPDGTDKIILEVGPTQWPMPIPLVMTNGQWHFDTAAGKEEIINRHIGKDEFEAIGVCRAYVIAQRRYAAMNPAGGNGVVYARHLKSTPGKKDGLYWPAAAGEPRSPFGSLVAEAQAEGYVLPKKGTGPHPFHGYYFRILTRQGNAAPGGSMDYLNRGQLTKGFALVAYPERWDESGVMTFIVNQDGQVYQQNLGVDTLVIAAAMKEYNPDNEWTLVRNEGLSIATLRDDDHL